MRVHDDPDHAGLEGGELHKRRNAEEAKAPGESLSRPAAELMRLQRLAGNRGVTAMLKAADGGPEEDADAGARGTADAVGKVLGSGGSPLDKDVRADMEASLGHDFSDVRVHTGDEASASAKALGAQAYTVGRDVVFQGDWNPGSESGKRTLAHELTHVVQQSAGPVDGTDSGDGLRVSDPSDRFEREAEHSADAVLRGGGEATPTGAGALAGAAVQRQDAGEEELPEEEQPAQLQRQAEGEMEEEEEQPAP